VTTRYWAVVPAAGIGKRMGAVIPKQYLPLAGRTVMEQTLRTLLNCSSISAVVVVISSNDIWWETIHLDTHKPLIQVIGGEERFHSVMQGLQALQTRVPADDWVLVHDAVRPCLRAEDLDNLIVNLQNDPVGGLLAMPVRDTMKRSDKAGRVTATVDRRGLWHALTPQMFRLEMLITALRLAQEKHLLVTDEASAVEAMGLAPRLVEGHADNIKITHPEDLALAEFYLTKK